MESVKEIINRWVLPLSCYSFDFGYGDGYEYSSGYSSGHGDGSGDGSGDSYSNGNGYSNGDGYGYGFSVGDGYSNGTGSSVGCGSSISCGCDSGGGYGYGYGDGFGVKNFCGQTVYNVDNMPTLITAIYGDYAKCAILNRDLTTTPCYIAKRDGVFAHGETLRKAEQALIEKLYDLAPLDERIDKFVDTHTWGVEYSAEDFYYWHHILTGSCEMGRKAFAKDHKIDIEHDVMTVEQFLELTKDAYSCSIIKMVKEKYKEN